MSDYFELSLTLHEQLRGKIAMVGKMPIETKEDLSVAYTPGVARPCEVIARDKSKARELTIKHNTVAVVSDGSAVLGLGNIGPHAAIPVMEGKALLFKTYAGIDAWPICLDTQDVDEIVETVRRIAPVFGGINLEDISAPRCFEVEERLQDLDIPVFHDDQHGTAIVMLAGLLNASKLTGKPLKDMRVVISGAGAAGTAITRLLRSKTFGPELGESVKDIIVCDSVGAIHKGRTDLNAVKRDLLKVSNAEGREGSIKDVIRGADVFIGVSKSGLLNADDIRSMAPDPMIFAMANPIPEIMPDEARRGGAAVICTGRSDFPNQINNVLVFPGIFRGALDAQATSITEAMKFAAVKALAACVSEPTAEKIIPSALDRTVAPIVGRAVRQASQLERGLVETGV
jgi:malate dehydrogenase (oxaloacetate-decarboxylating)